MRLVETLDDSATREHVVGAVRRMVVHSLNIARRKGENPGLEILPPEQIHASLSFLSAFGHFKDIQELHSDLLFISLRVALNLSRLYSPGRELVKARDASFRIDCYISPVKQIHGPDRICV